jgi:protein SCO1/2
MTPILTIRHLLSFFLGIILLSSAVVYAQNEKMGMPGDKEVKMSGDSHSMHTVNSFEPKDVEGWVEEKTGEYIPLNLEFVDEDGKKVTLGSIIDRPTIILPIYFYCPSICSRSLSNLATALKDLSFQPGKDYRVIAFSFNDVENFKVASNAKANYLKIVGDDFPPSEWRFLTGGKENIKKVTDSLGFRFQKMNDTTFIHPSALMTVSAEGQIIRYVYGSFLAGDIDMALYDAERKTPSLSVKRLLAFCFNYDPDANKSIFQTIKVVVVGLFIVVLSFVFFFFKKKGQRKKGHDLVESSDEQDKKR